MEQNRKRRNIGIIAGVVVVLLIAGISAALIVLNQPKVRLARGISKMSKELTAYSSPAAKQINKSLYNLLFLGYPCFRVHDRTSGGKIIPRGTGRCRNNHAICVVSCQIFPIDIHI